MAELKLKVSLDTSYLKGQIARLPLEFAGANVSIRPKFDKQAIVSEFAALNRYINSKRFNIVINTNLEAEIKNADRLVKALGRVQQAASGAKGGLPIGTQALSRTKGQGGFAAAEIKALFGAAVQGGLIDDKTLASTRAQMVTALGRIGRDSIAGLLNGLKSGDADIQAAAQMLGKNLITSFKTVLGIASPSKEFKKLGEAAGQGFEQGLLKSIEIAEQSATRKMQRMLDRLARMVLMMGGMSGPEIGRQIAQARALPSLNFGATTPRTSVAIGPSSTGRALPAGADRLGLPGTSFTSQKLLSGDLLTPSMKAAIRDAANELVDNLRGSLNNAIREVNVRDLGRMGAPMLGGIRTAGFLPAGVGRSSSPYSTGRLGREGETRAELFARREREARMRSALRGVDIMGEGGIAGRSASPYSYAYRGARPQSAIVPYSAGGAIVPVASRGGGGGGGGGGTGGGPGNFAGRGGGPGGGFNMPNLPGAGLVREIGQEFAFATKQVLLFGTAYKALAFLQSFPAQVGAAVGALQSFRNTIGEISPSAQEAAASSQFILDIVDKYNVPLQSARDGFIKLYASMQPAGFSGNEIRDLFLGISQTAATFGMSAEKVDRVNYAFAQMASKGQVMSEELKGQLGDVLPGAMAIFAEAAGFEGPEALTKFSKALEDGAYKGGAMKTLLTNVGIIMRKEFGPGAEGAARTFQGVMNRMQNSMKLLYESFEPVAVEFLNAIVMPMTSGIQTLTDGFNAFFKGQAAQTIGGSAVAEQLNSLKPAFEGILTNIKSLIPSFQLFGGVIFNAVKLLASLAGNPIIGFLFNVYTNVLLVNTAFTLLGGKILLGVIASVNATIARIIALGFAMNALGVQTMGAKTALAGTQLQMLLLQRSAAGMVGPLTLSNLAMAALAGKAALVVGGLVLLGKGVYDTNETFRNFVNNIGGVIASDFKNAVDGMAKDANASANNIQTAYEDLTTKLDPIGQFIRELFKNVFKDTSDSAEASATASSGSFNNFFNSLSTSATEGFNGLNTIINNWWSSLPAPIRNIFGGNAASMLVGAAGYLGGLPSRTQSGGSPERQGPYLPPNLPNRNKPANAIGTPIGSFVGGGGGSGGGGKDAKPKRIPLEQLLPPGWESALKVNLSKAELRLTELITTARLQGNEAEAESLEGVSGSLQLRIKLAAATNFANMLRQKEGEIIAKSLTKEQFNIRLKDADNEAAELSNELQRSYLEMQVRENDAQKKAKNALNEKARQQLSLNRLLEDAAILAGVVSPQQAAIGGQRRGFQDQILQAKELGAKPEQILSLEAFQAATPQAGSLQEALRGIENELNKLISTQEMVKASASAIGDAFGNVFKGIITGSMTAREALAGFFQSVADSFADMAAKMIAEWAKMQIIGLVQSLLAPVAGGFAGAFGSSGPSFNAGAFSGPALSGGLTGAANYSSAFSGGMGGFNSSSFIPGFANGAIVTGPTLGLVGEGRYNEAVIPLPDGKSVPVQLSGGDGGNQINSNITVNVSNGQAQSNATGSNSSELGRKIEGAVKQVIVGELRPGGLLASR